MFPPGYFAFIHASPPCQQYSIARSNARTPRDLEGADRLAQRVLDIIEYFDPLLYTIENPATGLLKTRDVLEGWRNWVDTSYCRWTDADGNPYQYRKATRFWTNLKNFGWNSFRRAANVTHVM